MIRRSIGVVAVAVTLAIALGGCADRVAFTREVMVDYALEEADLSGLQYYLSSDLLLGRTDIQRATTRSSGELHSAVHTVKDYIAISDETPGIALKVTSDELQVSFEEGSSFTFKCIRGEGELVYGAYCLAPERVLTADEVQALRGEARGTCVFTYRGKSYYASPEHVDKVYLVIKKKDLARSEKRRHELRGRRLSE